MNNPYFSEIKNRFGFGCMRLPLLPDGEVDLDEFSRMIEAYFDAGFNYFDTARGYLDGKSETAIKACLTSKYPREKYILTDKLTRDYFKCEADIRPLFEKQLEACGVDYFDFYLMHGQVRGNYDYFKSNRAYETILQLKEEGKLRHFGISFHGTAEFLTQILTEYPQIEVVLIQHNFVDYEDPAVQSKRLVEVCRKFGKPVLVMEPIKGGSLIRLPEEAQRIFDALHGGSNASYALRFAASDDQIMMVLSGMSNLEQMKDNISFMGDNFKPLNEEELAAVKQVCEIFRAQDIIPCTACRYCTAGCPKHIRIPDIFACVNAKKVFNDWNQDFYYSAVVTGEGDRAKASDCIKCGQCEAACPQQLPIRKLLEDAAALFEKKAAA